MSESLPSPDKSDRYSRDDRERIALYQARYIALLVGHGYEATEQRAAFLKLMEGKEYGGGPLLSAWAWFREGLTCFTPSHAPRIECEKCGNPTDGTKACTLHGERCIFARSTTPQMPGETPRTEAMIESCGDYEKAYHYNGRFAEFARRLERELAALNELLAHANGQAMQMGDELERLQTAASAIAPKPASDIPLDGVYLGWIASKASVYGGWWEVVCYGNWDFYDEDDNWKEKQDDDGQVKGHGWYAEREGSGDRIIIPLGDDNFGHNEKLTYWLPLPPRINRADGGKATNG